MESRAGGISLAQKLHKISSNSPCRCHHSCTNRWHVGPRGTKQCAVDFVPSKEGGMTKRVSFVLILTLLASSCLADEYVLVMSKDDCVCRHMLQIYNEDLKEYGEIKYDQHEEFNAIKWGKQESYFEVILPDKTVLKEHDTLISRFDINNDGSPEIILKDEHRTLSSVDSDALYIFREKDFADFKDKIVINEAFAKKAIGGWGNGVWGNDSDENPFRANVYWLRELPAFEVWTRPTRPGKQIRNYYSLGGWFYFYPFVYQGKYFTSMHDWLPETGKEWDTEYEKYVVKKWEVILRLTPENQLKDICYLLKVRDCKNKKED